MATVIFKPIEDCNSNCVYCDVVRKERTTLVMPPEILEQVFVRINEFLLGRPDERLTLTWHGGEPLLLGAEYLRSALEVIGRCCPDTRHRIEHGMQSNLTLLSEELIDILRRLGINSLGTSYDPEPHMRGPGKDIDSDRYNRMFMSGVELLERHGMGWGYIYVVTKKSLANPLDVFYFLTNLNLTGGVNLNPVLIYDEERRDIAVTPEEYVDFLGAIFPTWWRHQDRYPGVEPFRSLKNCIKDRQLSLGCCDAGNCAYDYINITPDGSASHCGRSADWGILSYGNIMDLTFEEILANDQREQLRQRTEQLPQGQCKDCRFWGICHGGCPLDSFSSHKDFMHKSEWCEARRGFIERYFEPVTGIRFEPYE
ncbi:MAG: radical SAM protein [Nitrospirae bacterium]|nr:radical SAM protein [Nitrospirota bacterium]